MCLQVHATSKMKSDVDLSAYQRTAGQPFQVTPIAMIAYECVLLIYVLYMHFNAVPATERMELEPMKPAHVARLASSIRLYSNNLVLKSYLYSCYQILHKTSCIKVLMSFLLLFRDARKRTENVSRVQHPNVLHTRHAHYAKQLQP